MKIVGMIFGGIVVVLLIIGAMIWGTYNNLVVLDQNCDGEWAKVQVQYQRRFDLIPRVVEVTKDYIQYEGELLTNITQARSAWTKAFQSGDVAAQAEVGDELGALANRLMVIVSNENYPELGSKELVQDLIVELEGTENRIAQARNRYTEAVNKYNKAIRMFPNNIIAGMFGFTLRINFHSVHGANDPVEVDIY